MAKQEQKTEEQSKTKNIKPDLKNLYYSAWAKALEEVNKAEKAYEDIVKNPKGASPEKLIEAVYNKSVAFAKIDILEESFLEEGGEAFPHKGK